MYAAAQRKHTIQSFDQLLRILLVYSYLVDPYLIRLVVRFAVQLQLSNPRELDTDGSATLRFFLGCLAFVHLGPIARHLIGPINVDIDSPTIILDFVGRTHPMSSLHIAILDISIFLLQAIMLVISYETYGQHLDAPDPLVPSFLSKSEANHLQDDEYAPLVGSTSHASSSASSEDPIFHIRLRTTFERIRHPPAPDSLASSDLSNPNTRSNATTRSSSDLTTTRRLMTRAFHDMVGGRGGAIAGTNVVAANFAPPTTRPTSNDSAPGRIPGSLPLSPHI